MGVKRLGSFMIAGAALLLALAVCGDANAEEQIGCREKGYYDTSGWARGVAVNGDHAYIADGDNGLVIVDIGDKSEPRYAGGYDTDGYARGVAVSGDYAYIADGDNGLVIVDSGDKGDPRPAGWYDTSSYVRDVAVNGDYAYIADGDNGLVVVDISDPENPKYMGGYDTDDYAYGVAVSGDYAYVADWNNGLVVVDISDPENPQYAGGYDTPGYARGVAVSGDYAYVADGGEGLVIVDIGDKSEPRYAGGYDTSGYTWGVAVNGDYAYIADEGNGLVIVDVGDKSEPRYAGGYDTSGCASGVAVSGDYAYIADYDNGLVIVELAPVAWIDEISPNPALDTDNVHFEGHGTDDGTITRYAWRSSLDGELHNGTASDFDTDELTLGGHTIYFRVRDGHGVWSYEVFSWLLVETDGDGVGDDSDAFPTDPAASKDTDDDGYPDEWNPGKTKADSTTGLELDAFPADPDEWKDSDGDGVGDNSDDFKSISQLQSWDQTYVPITILFITMLAATMPRKARKWYLKSSSERIITLMGKKQERLKKEGIEFDDTVALDAVYEFQHEKYKSAKNFAKAAMYQLDKELSKIEKLRGGLERGKKALEEGARCFRVDELQSIHDTAVSAFKEGDFEGAKEALNSFDKTLKALRSKSEPQLSLTIPDPIPTHRQWHIVRVVMKNSGAAHARNVSLNIRGGGQIQFSPVSEIRSGEEITAELRILLNESGMVPVVFYITAVRPQDNKPFTNTSELWLNVGSAAAAPGAAPVPARQTTDLKILRETENFRGFVRIKIGIVNDTGAVITDCRLRLILDTNVLRFDRVEPSYITRGEEIELGNINHREKKTVAVYLDPMMCTTTTVDAVLTYRDIQGSIQTEKMRPKEINVVCPIFFTQDVANIAMLKNLVSNVLRQQDSKIFNIPRGLPPQEAFETAKSAVSGRKRELRAGILILHASCGGGVVLRRDQGQEDADGHQGLRAGGDQLHRDIRSC